VTATDPAAQERRQEERPMADAAAPVVVLGLVAAPGAPAEVSRWRSGELAARHPEVA
jgi:hypothetical protein